MAASAGVVLAGGRSSRMGTPRAALEWHGSTLLRRTTGILSRVADRPVVVVRAPGQAPHFRAAPPPAVARRVCRDASRWLRGAGTYLAASRERYRGQPGVEVAEVSCLGRCDAARAVAVHDCPATAGDADGRIRRLEQAMRKTSVCGLGQVAPGPVVSVIDLGEQRGERLPST